MNGLVIIKTLPYCIIIRKNTRGAQEARNWRNQKKNEVAELILSSAGIFIESYALEYITHPKSDLNINIQAINRSNSNVKLLNIKINSIYDSTFSKQLENNVFLNYPTKSRVA